MNIEKTFDATDLLAELDGGVLNEKLSKALRDVAEGAMANERQGKVAITSSSRTSKTATA